MEQCVLRYALTSSVALFLAGMSLPAWAADTLFFNAKVFTGNQAAPAADAVAVRDGNILAVGARDAVEKEVAADAEKVDLKGGFLMPGMIDAHAHAIFGGFNAVSAVLPEETTKIEDLAAFAKASQESGLAMVGDVVRISLITAAMWEPAQLDSVFNVAPYDKTPVVLVGSDGHTGWANKPMLERAGITTAGIAAMSDADKKFYTLDVAGNPNGFLADKGWDRALAAMPPVPVEAQMDAMREAIKEMNGVGVTAWLDPLANIAPSQPVFSASPPKEQEGVLPIYKALAASGELSAHVTGMALVNAASGPEGAEVYSALAAKYPKTDQLMVGGIKVFADGVIEFPAQTALLSKPYSNLGTAGPDVIGTDKFGQLVAATDKAGGLVHIHAIGDLAVTQALDGIAAARKVNGNSGIPHSITHLEIVQPSDFPRFKELGAIAVMQLLWAIKDEFTVEMLEPYIDPELYKHIYPAASLYKAGATIAGASDWPVSSPNPFLAIATAIARQGPDSPAPLAPEEAMTAEQMLYAYTINAARAVRREDRIGSIEPGKAADLVLIDRDVLAADPASIAEAKVMWTMFGGKKVFEAK
eukprot:GDKH01003165.1.p1 GENE.GDKH01003165.1~~GDKH01003165.1.p1  ORF type:complete len:586 (+),score=234.36 GDKH01003165.1:12171-13928(+)